MIKIKGIPAVNIKQSQLKNYVCISYPDLNNMKSDMNIMFNQLEKIVKDLNGQEVKASKGLLDYLDEMLDINKSIIEEVSKCNTLKFQTTISV